MRRLAIFFLTVTVAGTLFIGCVGNSTASTTGTAKDSASTFDLAAARKIIEENDAKFAKAFVSGDSAGLVNCYTQDGKLFPPNADAAIGRPAIGAVASQYMKFGIKEFRDEITALYGTADYLVEEGNFFMGDGKGKTL